MCQALLLDFAKANIESYDPGPPGSLFCSYARGTERLGHQRQRKEAKGLKSKIIKILSRIVFGK